MMKRILCIDGGGIRGTFPAAVLARLEQDLSEPIGSYFDLIAGTSTGGIIAIGLGLGIPAQEILEVYETRGPMIFSQARKDWVGKVGRKWRTARSFVWGHKYPSDELQSALKDVLGDSRIGDSRTRLLIPAWHPQTQKVYIFKTAHHRRLKYDYQELAVDAALATAAAPTFFKEHIKQDDVGLIDGGIWANNPTALAVVEAVGLLGWKPPEIKVLSLGCLEDITSFKGSYGKAEIASKLAPMFMSGQSHGSMGMAKILLGDPHENKSIYRVSQPVRSGDFSLDNTNLICKLKDRGMVEAREQQPILEPVFFHKTDRTI